MENKKQYIAPELTVVTFKVEQGFYGSNQQSIISLFSILPEQNYNQQAQENWQESGNYFGNW